MSVSESFLRWRRNFPTRFEFIACLHFFSRRGLPWDMHHILVPSLWGILIVCAILTELIPSLRSISAHGKCRASLETTSSRIDFIHSICQVPKSYFRHMYALGSLLALTSLYCSLSFQQSFQQILCLLLWTLHNLRRLWESFYITIYGSSTMHVGGYLVGLFHYVVAPVTFLLVAPPTHAMSIDMIVLSATIFLLANWIQFNTHLILYILKASNKRASPFRFIYQVPTESYFRYICCPHYLSEILIYLSFTIIFYHDPAIWCMLLWVITNLSIVANRQYCWYQEQVDLKVPTHWKRLVPFVW